MDGRPTWTDSDEAGDYVVPNVLSPKDLVFRPDNMDETVPHTTYSFHRRIMGKVEIGDFYCLIGDNRILCLQKCLLNSSPYFIRLLSEFLNLICCRGNINSYFLKKSLFLKKHVYGISD